MNVYTGTIPAKKRLKESIWPILAILLYYSIHRETGRCQTSMIETFFKLFRRLVKKQKRDFMFLQIAMLASSVLERVLTAFILRLTVLINHIVAIGRLNYDHG